MCPHLEDTSPSERSSSAWRGTSRWCAEPRDAFGFSLTDRLRDSDWSNAERAGALLDVTAGLAYLHDKKVMHRDLRPSNILLLSFYPTTPFVSRILVWISAYVAPEVFNCDSYDAAVDIYAFAMITFEECTRVTPFSGLQPMRVAFQVSQGETTNSEDASVRCVRAGFCCRLGAKPCRPTTSSATTTIDEPSSADWRTRHVTVQAQ